MNRFQRVAGTLEGTPLDRRAFVPVMSLYGARMTHCPLQRYYTEPAAYVAGQIAVDRAFEPDMIFSPFAFALIGAAFGSKLKISGIQAPNISRPAITSIDEWDQLALPDPDTNPHLLYLQQTTRLMAMEFRDRVPIAACLPAPMDIPALVMGMEGWMELLMFNKKGAQSVLERTGQFFIQLANRLFSQGAMMAFVPCAYASPAVLMRDSVESLIRPAMKHALAQLKGPAVLHHCGAPLLAHLDILRGLPSAVGFALNYEEGLNKARQLVGPDPVLLSGPHGPSLVEMKADQVETLCRSILQERDMKKERRFILVTLGADVPYDTPPENLDAIRKALAEVGWNAT